MNHTATSRLWRCYGALPADVRDLADEYFRLLKADPNRPSLHFKMVVGQRVYSARVGLQYRTFVCQPPIACIGSGSAPTRTTTDGLAAESKGPRGDAFQGSLMLFDAVPASGTAKGDKGTQEFILQIVLLAVLHAGIAQRAVGVGQRGEKFGPHRMPAGLRQRQG